MKVYEYAKLIIKMLIIKFYFIYVYMFRKFNLQISYLIVA